MPAKKGCDPYTPIHTPKSNLPAGHGLNIHNYIIWINWHQLQLQPSFSFEEPFDPRAKVGNLLVQICNRPSTTTWGELYSSTSTSCRVQLTSKHVQILRFQPGQSECASIRDKGWRLKINHLKNMPKNLWYLQLWCVTFFLKVGLEWVLVLINLSTKKEIYIYIPPFPSIKSQRLAPVKPSFWRGYPLYTVSLRDWM